jgi:hypothetical protein
LNRKRMSNPAAMRRLLGARSAVALAAVLAASVSVVPSHAGTKADERWSATAGSWTYVELPGRTTFQNGRNPVIEVTASRGRFAGLALDSPGASATYVVGRTAAPCPFSQACPTANWPTASAVVVGGGSALPAGRYRLSLLGEPGTRVTVRLRYGAIDRLASQLPRGHGTITVDDDAAVGVPDHQVVEDSRFSFRPASVTVVGAVVHLDLDNPLRASVDFCARSEGALPSVPGGVACSGDDVVSDTDVYASGVGPCSECFPVAASFSMSEASAAVLRGRFPELRVHSRVAAARSRITLTAFALTLPGR